MLCKSMFFGTMLLFVAGSTRADEFDAVINDGTRGFTTQANSPEKFFYGRVTLDSKGQIAGELLDQPAFFLQKCVRLRRIDGQRSNDDSVAWQRQRNEGFEPELFRALPPWIEVRVQFGIVADGDCSESNARSDGAAAMRIVGPSDRKIVKIS